MIQQYEYKLIDTRDVEREGIFKKRNREDLEDYINAFGQQGWELVAADFRELEGGVEFSGVMKRSLNV